MTRYARVSLPFVFVRLRDWLLDRPHSQEWLLVEWPTDEKEPTKYWLSTLPEDATLLTLVDMAKLRWRICSRRRQRFRNRSQRPTWNCSFLSNLS